MKILITDGISEKGLEKFLEEKFEADNIKLKPEELLEKIKDYDGLVVRSETKVTKEVINNGAEGRLKIVGRAGVGVDNIDIDTANEKGVIVKFAPSGATISVAELTIGLMLNLARNINNSSNAMKQGLWKKEKGCELFEKTLGIIGCGRIGTQIARTAKHGFEMNILGFDKYPNYESGINFVNLDELFGKADYITLNLPKQKEPIITERELKKMKESAYLVDASRGGNVNESDLYNALHSKTIAGAAKDVFIKEGKKFEEEYKEKKNPLLELDNFLPLPHLGASTYEGQIRTSCEIADVVIEYLKYGDSRNAVNVRKREKRGNLTHNLFVTHKDSPGVFAKISFVFGGHNINIVEQKTEYLNNGNALTVYLAEKPIYDDLIKEVKNITEVYSAKR